MSLLKPSNESDSARLPPPMPSLRQRLSFKLALNAVAVAFVIGVLLTSGQIILDYFNETQLLEEEVNRALTTARESATLAAYNLDETAAQQITRGLASNLSIVEATISDNFGQTLGQSLGERQEVSWVSRRIFGAESVLIRDLYNPLSDITLLDDGNQMVGTLRLAIDPALSGNAFIERSMFALASGLLRNFILAAGIILVFYFTLTKTLLAVSYRVSGQQSLRSIDIPEDHRGDELGVLIRAFNLQLKTIEHQHEEIVSNHNKLEQTVIERTAQLDEQNKQLVLEREKAESASVAKGEFLAMMSHEVRTPMNGILGVAKLLANTELNQRQQEFVEAVVDASESLLTLMNTAFDYARGEQEQLEFEYLKFDIHRTLQSVVFLMGSAAERKGSQLSLHIDEAVATTLVGDAERLRQVLLNLISNAVKFTSEGDIKIRVSASPQQDGFQWLNFRIEDTGIGIAAERHALVFEPYQQAGPEIQQQYGGTGMGLAISRRIVEQQGGEIGFESEVEVGSCFWFKLEFALSDDLPSSKNQSQNQSSSQIRETLASRSVLVVDDVALNRNLAEWYLDADGHLVDVASDGQEAVSMAKLKAYDLILMDINMPIMDGLEASAKIRASGRQTYILGVSAFIDTKIEALAKRAGIDQLMSKPLDYPLILNRLQQAAMSINQDLPPEEEAKRQSKAVLVVDEILTGHFKALGTEKAGHLYRTALKELDRGLMAVSQQASVDDYHKLAGLCANFGLRALEERFRHCEETLLQGQTIQQDSSLDGLVAETKAELSERIEAQEV